MAVLARTVLLALLAVGTCAHAMSIRELRTLEANEKEGKLYVTVCVGCTGGRHRSVAVVEELRRRLGGDWDILVRHRDVELGEGRSR